MTFTRDVGADRGHFFLTSSGKSGNICEFEWRGMELGTRRFVTVSRNSNLIISLSVR
jgi:hypothetical protein